MSPFPIGYGVWKSASVRGVTQIRLQSSLVSIQKRTFIAGSNGIVIAILMGLMTAK